MHENLGHVIASQDSVLLGRRTYDEWAGFWPTSDQEPFASFINGTQKYVVTSSEPTVPWAKSTVVDGSMAAFVRDLKGRSGGDIGVHGSISLAQSLLQEGLVDELKLVVSPVVAVEGRKLFDRDAAGRKLELLSATGTPSGSLLVDYRVAS